MKKNRAAWGGGGGGGLDVVVVVNFQLIRTGRHGIKGVSYQYFRPLFSNKTSDESIEFSLSGKPQIGVCAQLHVYQVSDN